MYPRPRGMGPDPSKGLGKYFRERCVFRDRMRMSLVDGGEEPLSAEEGRAPPRNTRTLFAGHSPGPRLWGTVAGSLWIQEVPHDPLHVLCIPPGGPHRPARIHRLRSTRPALESLEPRVALSLGAEFPVSTGTADHHMSDNASSSNGMSVVVWVDESSGSKTRCAPRSMIRITGARARRSSSTAAPTIRPADSGYTSRTRWPWTITATSS